MSEPQKHVYNVEMTCEGCSGAVERVLGKLKGQGVANFDVSLSEQKVTVTTSEQSELSAEQILEVIQKTGKPAKYVGCESDKP